MIKSIIKKINLMDLKLKINENLLKELVTIKKEDDKYVFFYMI